MCDVAGELVVVEAALGRTAAAWEVQQAAESVSRLTGRSVLVVLRKAAEPQPNTLTEWSAS